MLLKKTLILGASPNPERYSHKAILMLSEKGHEVFPVGLRKGKIGTHEILVNQPALEDIHTVTLYVGKENQLAYYDYILKTIQPQRIIFNPGTENDTLMALAQQNGVEAEVACTLVLLSLNEY